MRRITMRSVRLSAFCGVLLPFAGCREAAAPDPARLAGPASADVAVLETIYGPERFTRAAGKPAAFARQVSTRRFEAPFVMRVRSGDAAGGHRVSSATIRLDGAEVVGPDALNRNVGEVTIDVSPADIAMLEVSVAGAPGDFLEISIEGKRSATLFCPDGRPGSVGDLQQAVDQTPAGGTVEICDGTHVLHGIGLLKPITIDAAGPGTPVLDPGSPGNFTFFAENRSLAGAITIRNLELLSRGASAVFVSSINDHVVVEHTLFRMIPTPNSTGAAAAGGTGIFARAFPGVPPVSAAVLDVRSSEFHGGFRGIDVGNGIARAEVTGSRFEHAQAAGFAIGVGARGRLVARANTFEGCGEQCVGGGPLSEVDFDDNLVMVDLSAPAASVVNTGAVLRMNRNTITGVGRDAANPDPGKRYPISVAIQAGNGATIFGSDNRISGVNFALNAFGIVDMHRNDITDYGTSINGGLLSDLRCNWWGSVAAPSTGAPASSYTPWALEPIAGRPAVGCAPF
jgi:hypothetical protein